MSFVTRIMGANPASRKDPPPSPSGMLDGALDTLTNMFRVLGDEAFQLDKDFDPSIFPEMCEEFAQHIENGAAIPSHDIPAEDGSRAWSHVRRFFADRRRAENAFVSERIGDYRGVVEDLVAGLRSLGDRDQFTESSVRKSLDLIDDAVSTGVLPEIRSALAQTVKQINETFAEQKQHYEAQLKELNDRMVNLRQDLVAAREEMKRDALTDAYNRGAFDAAIAQSVNMHFILNQPVTVIMIDLDKFKPINDNYGHAAGDEALRAVGECLARTFIRKSDFVARYGGDEFAVILNDTTPENAAPIIDRFLRSAGGIPVPYAPEGVFLSCSAGYTEIHENDTVVSLIHRADKALYQAKREGRSQSVYLTRTDSDVVAKG